MKAEHKNLAQRILRVAIASGLLTWMGWPHHILPIFAAFATFLALDFALGFSWALLGATLLMRAFWISSDPSFGILWIAGLGIVAFAANPRWGQAKNKQIAQILACTLLLAVASGIVSPLHAGGNLKNALAHHKFWYFWSALAIAGLSVLALRLKLTRSARWADRLYYALCVLGGFFLVRGFWAGALPSFLAISLLATTGAYFLSHALSKKMPKLAPALRVMAWALVVLAYFSGGRA